MRQAIVFRNGIEAGVLTEESRERYIFRYHDAYLANAALPSISLTLPKRAEEYQSTYLFPFFFNMLSEGVNKRLQSLQLRIDEADSFGLLMATAQWDTIGAVTVKPIES